jgi:hypothetical protein
MKRDVRTRVTTGLTRDQVEFLDRLGTESKFSGGRKLGHSEVVRSMVGALRRLSPDLAGVRTEDEAVARILGARGGGR